MPDAVDQPKEFGLSATEAARRLGVKKETLYAYVSRGMLASRRGVGGKESRFDAAEVSGLAARRRAPGARAGNLEMVVDSAVSLLDPSGRLWYRGWDAAVACVEASFEEIAEWIWTGTRGEAALPFTASHPCLAAGRSVAGAAKRPVDGLRMAVIAGGLADPLRDDRRPEAVAATGHRILGLLVDSLPAAGPGESASAPGSIAGRLWLGLSPLPLRPECESVLNAALVLLADHEMASSTLAARVAASTWADPYLVVSAGLAILGGPLHGGASDRIVNLLDEAVAIGASEAVAARWRNGESVPGFGHMVYLRRDPRAEALWPLIQTAWPGHPIVQATGRVIDTVTAHGDAFPNVDLMLATMISAGEMIPGSGEAVFAISRTAGWLGHAIEEYQHRLRFRFRAAYTGPQPA